MSDANRVRISLEAVEARRSAKCQRLERTGMRLLLEGVASVTGLLFNPCVFPPACSPLSHSLHPLVDTRLSLPLGLGREEKQGKTD